LVEAVAEQDDAALHAYLEGVEPSADILRSCIRSGTLAGAFVPVLAGSAFRNRGIQTLLDAIVSYLPEPGEVAIESELRGTTDEAFVALAFKIVSDDHRASGMRLLRRRGIHGCSDFVVVHENRDDAIAQAKNGFLSRRFA
jgi:elongation factor G